jgi:hypothetical protein
MKTLRCRYISRDKHKVIEGECVSRKREIICICIHINIIVIYCNSTFCILQIIAKGVTSQRQT